MKLCLKNLGFDENFAEDFHSISAWIQVMASCWTGDPVHWHIYVSPAFAVLNQECRTDKSLIISMSHYGYSQCIIWNTAFKIHVIMKTEQNAPGYLINMTFSTQIAWKISSTTSHISTLLKTNFDSVAYFGILELIKSKVLMLWELDS